MAFERKMFRWFNLVDMLILIFQYCVKTQQGYIWFKASTYAWYHRLMVLIQLGFTCSVADSSLFTYSKGSTLIYVLVYVNNIVVTFTDLNVLDSMKNLGCVHYFLGIEAHFADGSLFLSKQIVELL